jgi:hypothetical protein
MTLMKAPLYRRLSALQRALSHHGRRAVSSQTFTSSHPVQSQRLLSSARPLPNEEISEWEQESPRRRRPLSQYPSPLHRASFAVPDPNISTRASVVKQTMTEPQEQMLSYSPDTAIPITSILHIVKPGEDTPRGIWPAFRLLVSRLAVAGILLNFSRVTREKECH